LIPVERFASNVRNVGQAGDDRVLRVLSYARNKAAADRLFGTFIFLNPKSVHTVSVTTRELPLISEQRRLPSPATTPQALTWDRNAKLLWMGSRDLRRIYAIDAKEWTVVEEREAPGIRGRQSERTGRFASQWRRPRR